MPVHLVHAHAVIATLDYLQESTSADGLTRETVAERAIVESYYDPKDLAKFAEVGKDGQSLWHAFQGWYGAVFRPGALTAREKSLIALAVAHAVQCPYCIDAYTKDSLEKGADREQMTEAVHVAAAIKGGAALVHGVQMRNAADKISM